MNFGIGSFAYRWAIGRQYYEPENPMSVEELIDRVAAYGVKRILLCNNIPLHEFSTERLETIKYKLDKEGIIPETGSRGTEYDYFKKMIEVSEFLGSHILRVAWDMNRDTDAEGIRAQVLKGIETFKALMPECRKHNVQIAVENGKLNDIYEIRDMAEGVDDDYFGVAVDTCNSTCFITPTEEVFRVLSPYAKSVHFKDYIVALDPRGDVITGVPMGKGYVDFPKLIEILKENEYEGNIFLELYIDRCEKHEDTVQYEEECVRQSMEYAKNTLKLY
ncbi:sugar phosphate isomerase/epimerase family protein [Murimonas intestini]|uniref:sugar phosphate isomerase/epimerase family protein n=1 Tax=Murimonas intestini TaxID=1337051 RepID=UPI00248C5169|nr:sugar phosphate isomerase/epimerase family protein [Murimonas intestini]